MLYKIILRHTTARLAVPTALAVLCALGCANRGMVAPHDGGTGGVSTSGGSGGTVKTDGGAGNGGSGGQGGSGGMSGSSGKDASCSLLTDALVEHSTTVCNATFNFESGTEGATIPTTQAAFTSVITSGAQTYCGTGALAIATSFSGSTGLSVKGEVDLPLGTDGGTTNLNGKNITVHVSANPACDATLKMNVVVIDASGAQQFPLRNVPLTANWTTASATLSTDGGADSAIKIALDVTNVSGYQGTIYIDEIDIR